ncbi:MAG: DUF4145 domain-containing protein [Planctomycetales bacterium]|nr:DUF4145 domain-containing protein [Planctomycetales bacterium]
MPESNFQKATFKCPTCNVVAQQRWFDVGQTRDVVTQLIWNEYYEYRKSVDNFAQQSITKFLGGLTREMSGDLERYIPRNFSVATCVACRKFSLWVATDMVYPRILDVPDPNADMDKEIQEIYVEAARICADSPKGAAALLRLALQKLMSQLGRPGKNINDDIKELVAQGLSVKIQQALDLLRVVGNNAVHPGIIDFDDNEEVALKMFQALNLIADEMITKPKEIDELYQSVMPEQAKVHIQNRDGK